MRGACHEACVGIEVVVACWGGSNVLSSINANFTHVMVGCCGQMSVTSVRCMRIKKSMAVPLLLAQLEVIPSMLNQATKQVSKYYNTS